VHFDHGAQYLTARGPMFQAALDAAAARTWPAEGQRVGVPRMSSIPRALAKGLDLDLSREVRELVGTPGAWRLRYVEQRQRAGTTEEIRGEAGNFDAVVLAMPAPQAAKLLSVPALQLAGVLEKVRMAPCWTLMLAFADRLPLPDVLRQPGGPVAWAARDSSKPGRDHAIETWVVQAGADWSREHLERTPAEVEALLLAAFAALAGGTLPEQRFAAAHRWRYALVETPLGTPCLWDPTRGLGATGDWCIAARAEAAADSGVALAALIAAG
jgi:predicted NAD/FAD-dependent oxidoreductase